MLVLVVFPEVIERGYVKKELSITDQASVILPVNQADVAIEVPERTKIQLVLTLRDSNNWAGSEKHYEFSTDEIPDFVPGEMTVRLLSEPSKLGGDQKSKLGVDDSGKKEAIKEDEPVIEKKVMIPGPTLEKK